MNYKSKTYDNTNSGVLYTNSDDWVITHQGHINFDGDDQRIISVQRKNKDKEIISEIYKAIGTLKKNKTKTTPEQPDAKGVVNHISNVKPMLISAWRKESSEGSDEVNHRVSLSLKDFDDGQSKNVDTEKTIDTVGNNNPF